MKTKELAEYSLVIPLKDEQDNVIQLIEEIEPVMKTLEKPWELICINDGSTDDTGKILENLSTSKEFLRVITFNGNYGQSSAFDAGFATAKGNIVISMDGDRQNDPKDIPNLLKALEGYDMVCGRRKKRKDTFSKRIISKIANRVRSRLTGDGVADTGCSLKAYRTECLKKIKLYHGMHRFLPALFQIEGFRVQQVDVNHRERPAGRSKYHIFNRSLNTIADLFAVMWMRKRKLRYKVNKELP